MVARKGGALITRTEEGSLELWLEMVRGIVGRPTEELTLLDLCCGECTGTGAMKWDHHVAIDVVDWPTRKRTDLFIKQAVLKFLSKEGLDKHSRFDVCLCSDGIEHLAKEQGLKLLTEMKRVADVAIIIGPYLLDADATHPDTHKSAWTPEELEAIGWDVIAFPNWHATLKVGAFFASKGKLNDND